MIKRQAHNVCCGLGWRRRREPTAHYIQTYFPLKNTIFSCIARIRHILGTNSFEFCVFFVLGTVVGRIGKVTCFLRLCASLALVIHQISYFVNSVFKKSNIFLPFLSFMVFGRHHLNADATVSSSAMILDLSSGIK